MFKIVMENPHYELEVEECEPIVWDDDENEVCITKCDRCGQVYAFNDGFVTDFDNIGCPRCGYSYFADDLDNPYNFDDDDDLYDFNDFDTLDDDEYEDDYYDDWLL